MAATTTRPEPPEVSAAPVHRFDRLERVLHWVNATLFAVLIATALSLYVGSISVVVGRRELVRTIHVYTGLAVPVVFLVSLLPRWGRGLRADLRRLNRWLPGERRWLLPQSLRDPARPVRLGKFNPGQKLNAAFVFGATVVMLASGSIMKWFGPFPDAWRTGATFVHDWFAFFLGLAILGHVALGLKDREALHGITKGTVSREWAEAERPLWYEETTGEHDDPLQ